MPITVSPLRYPGGKSSLLNLVASILKDNRLQRRHYAEPYAGGCGLALALLYGGFVSDIHINDADPSIWAFWKAVLEHTDDFVELIDRTPVTIDEWHRQREIQLAGNQENPVQLGFSTFFLNRTNRSGIIQRAGVIGGLKQESEYKIDCRFKKGDLKRKIVRVSKYRSRIHLYDRDAIDFMSKEGLPSDAFFCIDPPYFNKGAQLYTNFYEPEDHKHVADVVLGLDNPWIVTYDNVPEIHALYKHRRQFTLEVNYSLYTKRVGSELLIASKGLRLPKVLRDRQTHRVQYRAA